MIFEAGPSIFAVGTLIFVRVIFQVKEPLCLTAQGKATQFSD